MMYDLWSDFHVEHNHTFDWSKHETESKILVLAGDTSNSVWSTLRVLEKACSKYEFVAFVPGNHDYYETGDREAVNDILEKKRPENSCFLDHSPFVYNDVTFIGGMGWYSFDFPGVGDIMKQAVNWMKHNNDFNYIQFSDKTPRDLAEESANRIKSSLIEIKKTAPNQKIVVVTHTVPTVRGIVPVGHIWASLNGGYYNSFMANIWNDDAIKPNTWCFGHTHIPHDFVENGVRFLCNPRGYRNQRTGIRSGPVTIDI